MRFARRENRVAVSFSALVRWREALEIAPTVDMSAHGIQVSLSRRVFPGRRVEVLFDGHAFPSLPYAMTWLTGTIVWTAERATGISLRLPDRLREHLREVASPSAIVVVNEKTVPTRSGVIKRFCS